MPTTSTRKSASRRKSTSARTASPKGRSAATRKNSSRARSASTKSRSKSRSASSRSRMTSSSSRTASGSRRPAMAKRASSPSRTKSQGDLIVDHDEIRQWVETRGGFPATVSGTERGSEAAGLLRIDFPGFSGEESLERIDWEEFFEKFDEANLAFLCDQRAGSKFNKFVARRNKRF
jgi:hypothetical protein